MRLGLLCAFAIVLTAAGCRRADERVVVYCAQDQEVADEIFATVQAETPLKIAPKYDTEANKSVSLVVELEQETTRPRCDVHWNNEILGTIRLARKGIYQPYTSPSAAHFPAWSRAKDGTWQAFAERARVLLVNTNLVPPADRPKSLFDLTDPKWKGKLAMAKPQFGTTATQAACLLETVGPDAAKAFYLGLKANGVNIVPGNKQAATGVSEGKFAIGMTDTDDAYEELHAGKPVEIIFPDAAGYPAHPRHGTLFLPHTIAVVKGAPNPEGAKALIDRVLTMEGAMANKGAFQFPLNPEAKERPPTPLKGRAEVKAAEVDFDKAADLWDEAQTFLRREFAQ
ncbi:extracellular solute-binding protein [Fimbriiglobus ruber]|uniref:Ferric iron ABC transporter, iron-binding protein n=1 Tax=Fimbriiglobus ruber TaxID=1908690 RepID=A0A225DFG9_9BACT|nr:extracellular solute-binding protein [Fimbriiglobus ruber]OWK35135.1 Ferric iron ABC transporter, iron-binding protein [Fimbriiglobus ruber]